MALPWWQSYKLSLVLLLIRAMHFYTANIISCWILLFSVDCRVLPLKIWTCYFNGCFQKEARYFKIIFVTTTVAFCWLSLVFFNIQQLMIHVVTYSDSYAMHLWCYVDFCTELFFTQPFFCAKVTEAGLYQLPHCQLLLNVIITQVLT